MRNLQGNTTYTDAVEEDYSEIRKEGLVDSDLTPEARDARNLATMSIVQPDGRRAVATFLGRKDYEKIENRMGGLKADLMLGCLREFARRRGGQLVWSVYFGLHGETVNVVQHTVKIDGTVLQILRAGYVFMHFPDERVVISAEPGDRSDNPAIFIAVRSSTDSSGFMQEWEHYARRHNHLRGRAFFANGEIVERKRACTWNDILLPKRTKKTIRTQVEGFLQNLARLKGLGVKTRRGIILSGPPGTGKTLLGKVLADTLNVSFLWVSSRHIRHANSFAEILAVARFVAPTILFMEDIDFYAEDRHRKGWAGLGDLLNQLDGCLDNEDLITIATTNRLEAVEPALRSRPGRFDRIVEFGPMDSDCRRQMLRRKLRHADLSDEDIEHLLKATDDYTGAQLEELSNSIYILAVQRDNARPEGFCSGENACCVPGDGEMESVSVDLDLIDSALAEVHVRREGLMGFRPAVGETVGAR